MADDDSDIDAPVLSAHALSALQEFLGEQQEAQDQFDRLREGVERRFRDDHGYGDEGAGAPVDMGVIKEDWQLSQFWYDDDTATTIATEALARTSPNGRIACVSTPTAFVKLQSMNPSQEVYLFEFDERFSMYGARFVRYDYRTPTEFLDSAKLKGSFDFIVADPPFLSDECCAKTATTIRWLERKDECKVMVCTGAMMGELWGRLIQARETTFRPRHKNDLANEFRCYLTYESERLPWTS